MSQTPTISLPETDPVEAYVLALRPKIYRCCYRHLRHAADAEDATQDVFRKYLESFATIHGNPEAWLIRCARNTCVDHIRRSRRRRSREAERSEPEVVTDRSINQRETAELVHHLLAQLTPDEAELLRRHLVERVPQTTLAAQLGVSQQLVSRRVSEAKAKVKDWVLEHLGTLGLGGLLSTASAGTARAGLALATLLQRVAPIPGLPLFDPKLATATGTLVAAMVLPSSETVGPAQPTHADAGPVSPRAHVLLPPPPAADRSAVRPTPSPLSPPHSLPPQVPPGPSVVRMHVPHDAAVLQPERVPLRIEPRAVAVPTPGPTPRADRLSRRSGEVGRTPAAEEPRPTTDPSTVRRSAAKRIVRGEPLEGRVADSPFARRAALFAASRRGSAKVGTNSTAYHLRAFGWPAPSFAQELFVSATPDDTLDLFFHADDRFSLSAPALAGPPRETPVPADDTPIVIASSSFAAPPVSAKLAGGRGEELAGSILNVERLELDNELVLADLKSPRGSELVLNGVNRFAGNVSGAGHLRGEGTAIFAGTHSPGDSPAFVDVGGSLVYASGSRLHLELAGTADGDYDRLTVAGDVALAGELALSLIDGFRLAAAQDFLVLDVAGAVRGQFANYGEGDRVSVRLEGGGLAPTGDVGLFITYQAGDGNDVALFTRPLGSAGRFTVAVVPEPGTLLGLMLATPWVLGRSRRRASAFRI